MSGKTPEFRSQEYFNSQSPIPKWSRAPFRTNLVKSAEEFDIWDLRSVPGNPLPRRARPSGQGPITFECDTESALRQIAKKEYAIPWEGRLRPDGTPKPIQTVAVTFGEHERNIVAWGARPN